MNECVILNSRCLVFASVEMRGGGLRNRTEPLEPRGRRRRWTGYGHSLVSMRSDTDTWSYREHLSVCVCQCVCDVMQTRPTTATRGLRDSKRRRKPGKSRRRRPKPRRRNESRRRKSGSDDSLLTQHTSESVSHSLMCFLFSLSLMKLEITKYDQILSVSNIICVYINISIYI